VPQVKFSLSICFVVWLQHIGSYMQPETVRVARDDKGDIGGSSRSYMTTQERWPRITSAILFRVHKCHSSRITSAFVQGSQVPYCSGITSAIVHGSHAIVQGLLLPAAVQIHPMNAMQGADMQSACCASPTKLGRYRCTNMLQYNMSVTARNTSNWG